MKGAIAYLCGFVVMVLITTPIALFVEWLLGVVEPVGQVLVGMICGALALPVALIVNHAVNDRLKRWGRL